MSIPTWSLDDLFKGDDAALSLGLDRVRTRAEELTAVWRSRLPAASSSELREFLVAYEALLADLYTLESYASLAFSVDTEDAGIGKRYQRAQEVASEVSTALKWVDLSLASVADEVATDPALRPYAYVLEQTRRQRPHLLDEQVEQVLEQKAQTGREAFVRLYDQLQAAERYDFDGQELGYAELTKILNADPNRSRRERAAAALTEAVKANARTNALILNTLLLDKTVNDKLRAYEYPEQATLLGYDVPREVLEALDTAVADRVGMVERYYQKKRELLGVSELHEWDRYVPLGSVSREYTWDEAREICLRAFARFSPEFAAIARRFFNEGWIDARPASHKRSGAFCSYAVPAKHPYILLTFTGKLRDVTTLAHELGHGVHAYLSREHSLLSFWPSTATAEIASIFAEQLVFDALLADVSPAERRTLIAQKLEDSFASVFRQQAFYRFEREIYVHRQERGELSVEEFGDVYQRHLQAMFGDGLRLTENHAWWWSPILHFYHYRFYVFTYAMGEVLANALYAKYVKDRDAFVPAYMRALTLGGSTSPMAITRTLGADITDSFFWHHGLDVLEHRVDEFL